MPQYPNWVAKNPTSLLSRLQEEVRLLNLAFPHFKLMMDGDVMYAAGHLVTRSMNAYEVRLYYPENFPYEPPEPIVYDGDVMRYCLAKGMHGAHNRGEKYGGLFLCVLKPDDRVGVGWSPEKGGYFILNIAAAWLHAHEVQTVTGNWILPEAN